ncbi:response regulator [Loktanella sp. DJP18]|uniref:response regulator n=1 Tax=Loktanella sp. DJP18 TaxID=3409788 RepID=UPI003BB4B8A1
MKHRARITQQQQPDKILWPRYLPGEIVAIPSAQALHAISANFTRRPVFSAADPTRSHSDDVSKPLRVLIVEDEAIIAMDLEMILEDLGVEVVGIAMSAEHAVRLAEKHAPDCATMDINIKGDRDGVSAATEIYEKFGIRSIFVSAFGTDELYKRAEPTRPFTWIKKPFRSDDFKAALQMVRDHK